MTLHQLMTLTERHRLATSSSHEPHHEPAPNGGAGGFGPLGMAAMGMA
jgi:hypothetical protein